MLIFDFAWKLQPPQAVKRRRAQCAPPPRILDIQKSPHLLGLRDGNGSIRESIVHNYEIKLIPVTHFSICNIFNS